MIVCFKGECCGFTKLVPNVASLESVHQWQPISLKVGTYCLMWYVQMAMDYARHTHQELIMVQLDLKRAYYHDNWSIVSKLMHTMGGVGPCISP